MLHYNPRHVSSINMPIFRRSNCIITAFGIVTLCKRLYSMTDDCSAVCSHRAYCTVPEKKTSVSLLTSFVALGMWSEGDVPKNVGFSITTMLRHTCQFWTSMS